MKLFDELVEQRIAAAVADGEFDNLEGEGGVIDLDEDPLVPEDMRLAYRVLKNAGYAPAEVSLRKEIAEIERAIAMGDADADATVWRRLLVLRTHLSLSRGAREPSLAVESAYYQKLTAQMFRRRS